MSSTIPSRLDESSDPSAAGAERSEPGGRAKRGAGGGRSARRSELAAELKALLPDELLDEMLAGARTEEEITGPDGLLSQLTRRLVERALEVELTDHLGYEPHQEPPGGVGNTRNGSTAKTLLTEQGEVRIETPRDRKGTFEPQIVRKRQRRFEGFDDKILALYSRGLSTRDIEAHLEEIYGVKVGRDLISRVTDAVMDDARAWQSRRLMMSTRSCSSTHWCSRSATAARCSAKPATWRWRSRSTATARCSACGSGTQRAPSSGCRC